MPGVYVVKVTDEKTLQATTLVLGSDLDAIVKTSREQVLVFAQDMKTGKGRPGARVLVCRRRGRHPRGDDRRRRRPAARRGTSRGDAERAALALPGPRRRPTSAGSGLGVPDKVAQGLTARAYLYTDRPAYRPGQEVALRGVVREVKDGQYANVPGAVVPARGRPTAAAGRSSPGR